MIKECPTCKRTYSDPSMSFCLADGSLLSAPFDPQATQHLPVAHHLELPATEILYPAPKVNSLLPTEQAMETKDIPPTIASSEESDSSNDAVLQQTVESNVLVGLSGRKGVKLWVGLGIIFLLGAVYTMSIIPLLPALVLFVIALLVGLKKSGYEQL